MVSAIYGFRGRPVNSNARMVVQKRKSKGSLGATTFCNLCCNRYSESHKRHTESLGHQRLLTLFAKEQVNQGGVK